MLLAGSSMVIQMDTIVCLPRITTPLPASGGSAPTTQLSTCGVGNCAAPRLLLSGVAAVVSGQSLCVLDGSSIVIEAETHLCVLDQPPDNCQTVRTCTYHPPVKWHVGLCVAHILLYLGDVYVQPLPVTLVLCSS
jgi:hypothetical protein